MQWQWSEMSNLVLGMRTCVLDNITGFFNHTSTPSISIGLFYSLFWIKLKLSVGVKRAIMHQRNGIEHQMEKSDLIFGQEHDKLRTCKCMQLLFVKWVVLRKLVDYNCTPEITFCGLNHLIWTKLQWFKGVEALKVTHLAPLQCLRQKKHFEGTFI